MEFGYFTLSDNAYSDNSRTSESFLHDIVTESILADRLGMASVWIGEHHFNRRGCIPMPSLLLAWIAAEAKNVRLAPAVVVLPMHNPIGVAEEWATLDQLSHGRVEFAMGRGYDAAEYAPFGADFQRSAEIFSEGIDLLWRCWTEPEPFSFKGEFYQAENIQVCPRPFQKTLVPTVACFSRYSMEIAAARDWNIIFAPFATGLIFGGLAKATEAYRDEAAKHGRAPGKAKCSYFIHIGGSPAEEQYGRDCLLRYFNHSGMRQTRQDRAHALPPSMQYMKKVHEALATMKSSDLDEGSILVGSPQRIVDSLKRVEAAGIDEVILYFNHGLKPHRMVKEQMEQFMAEIAPAFGGKVATAAK